jgi:hypothetical protein
MEKKMNHREHGAIGALKNSGDQLIDALLAVRGGIKRVSI